MKKTVSLLLAFTMILYCVFPAVAVGVFASVSIESVQAEPGDVVSVRVSLADNPGIVSANIHVAFDEKLTLVGAVNGSVFPASMSFIPPKQLSTVGAITSGCNFAWSGTDISAGEIKNGTILTLEFLVSDEAQQGESYQITVSSRNGDVIDKDLKNVSFTPAVGVVTVSGNQHETQSARIVINSTEAVPGGSVFVPIILENNPGIVSANIHVAFDEKLTLVGAVNGSVFPASMSFIPPKQLATVGAITSGCNFAWSGTDISAGEIKNGTILTLEFLVSDEAQQGESYQITVSSRNGDVIDRNMNIINLPICTAAVTVNNPTEVFNPIDDFDYEIVPEGISITAYNSENPIVNIAKTYQINGVDYSVVDIAESAFEGNKTITEVYIPATVKSIGDYAFYDCTSLTKATVFSTDAVFGEKSLGYYYISRKVDGVTEGFTIIGYAGSTAEQYAATEDLIAFTVIENGDSVIIALTFFQALVIFIKTGLKIIADFFRRIFRKK